MPEISNQTTKKLLIGFSQLFRSNFADGRGIPVGKVDGFSKLVQLNKGIK